MSKAQKKTDGKWFVIWSDGDGDLHSATEFDTYEEAKETAEEYLSDNGDTEGEYYIAKATDKIGYEVKHEKF